MDDTSVAGTEGTASSTGSNGSDDFQMGELALLTKTLTPDHASPPTSDDEQEEQEQKQATVEAPSSLDVQSVYGKPLSEDKARAIMPQETSADGLVWYCTIIPNDYVVDGKLRLRGLNARDFHHQTQEIKSRRPSLPLTVSDFFSSITKVEEDDGSSRFIFNGILNGWPSLKVFEVVGVDKKRSIGPLTAPDYLSSSRLTWQNHWDLNKDGKQGNAPQIVDTNKIYRAKLRGPGWTSRGWSEESPGFVFWYEAMKDRVSYGTNMLSTVDDAQCVHVHMLSHRYAVAKESAKDRVRYHSVVLLEWDHGKYCTVVEGAYLNGIGGYQGRSNWYEDRDEQPNSLYKAFPPEMVSPWLTTAAEIRCYDVEAKNFDEFRDFVEKYKGAQNRFVDPRFTFSHPARLTYRSKSNIAQYCLNYISRDTSYDELKRNCQTLAADLCSFIAGKKNVPPFHPVNRIEYHNRTHLFLYDANLFRQKKHVSMKGKVVR